jgi:hypothetical protein
VLEAKVSRIDARPLSQPGFELPGGFYYVHGATIAAVEWEVKRQKDFHHRVTQAQRKREEEQ